MSEPWTPGPWKVDWFDYVFGGPPTRVVVRAGDIMAGKTHVVCQGHDYNDPGTISNPADARLISLAPEMAEALEYLLHPASGCSPKVLGWAGDLLARARGVTA